MESLKKKLCIEKPDESSATRVNSVFLKLKQRRLGKSDAEMINAAVLPESVPLCQNPISNL